MAIADQKPLNELVPASGGILPCQAIERLIEERALRLAQPVIDGQIQPASLDLRLGEVAYRIRASFLPGPNTAVEGKLEQLALHEIDLSEGAVLEVGCVYLAPLLESLSLPLDLSAACNPKSSTGRLDVFTRVITDRCSAFDKIVPGYHGPLYAEICPQSFPVLVRTGSRLSQIRFRAEPNYETPAPDSDEPYSKKLYGSTSLSVDLAGDPDTGFVGYRAKRHTGLVDMDKPAALDVLDFWEPIHARGQTQLILDPDQFYILASKQAVSIPPTHAAEMVPIDTTMGEFRVHYAGFFDPGFGYSEAGGEGAKAVLEVRSHKVPFILEDGQIIGQLIFEKLTEPPEQIYGAEIGSHYQAQGLKLSKHFR